MNSGGFHTLLIYEISIPQDISRQCLCCTCITSCLKSSLNNNSSQFTLEKAQAWQQLLQALQWHRSTTNYLNRHAIQKMPGVRLLRMCAQCDHDNIWIDGHFCPQGIEQGYGQSCSLDRRWWWWTLAGFRPTCLFSCVCTDVMRLRPIDRGCDA
jgi:hypothetical protein